MGMTSTQLAKYATLGNPCGHELQDAIASYNSAQAALAPAQAAFDNAATVLATKLAAMGAASADFKSSFALPPGFTWPVPS